MKVWTVVACLSLALNAGFIANIVGLGREIAPAHGQEPETDAGHGLLRLVLEREDHLVGRELDFTIIEKLLPLSPDMPPLLLQPGRRITLVLIFSRIGCNTCIEEQLEYLRDLGGEGDGALDLRAVVLDGDSDYVKRFRRVQRLNIPFYLAGDNSIQTWLTHDKGPLLLLVDPRTARILKAHVPNPDLLDRSRSFGHLLRALNEF